MKAATLVTFEEFEVLPELDAGKQELINGEVVTMPPANFGHGEISFRIFDALRAIPGISVRMEVGYLIKTDPRAWLQPDVSVRHSDQHIGDYVEGAPLLAIEVISDANRSAMMERKVQLYLQNGGKEVWLVYPNTRCVWVYRADAKVAERYDDILRSQLFPGFELSLQQLFTV